MIKPIVREIKPEQYAELETFLYHAIHIPQGEKPVPWDTIYIPSVFVYIEDFGRKDDVCYVAEIDGKIIGAAWARILAQPEKKGYGNIDEHTHELAVSILPEYRGQGIGTTLCNQLHMELHRRGFAAISLSVQKTNRALKLYNKLGYVTSCENTEDFITIKNLRSFDSI
ncbi:MAG: GNAT family N-acetyltransferase [Clostridiales bacterium]|jgi:ribosomal protein S18 acetylase RimI-like enzyme|nr:GNAT family N-acetyltransferase [Clostridiales bacterium]